MDCNGGKWRIVGNGALLRGGFVMPNPIYHISKQLSNTISNIKIWALYPKTCGLSNKYAQ